MSKLDRIISQAQADADRTGNTLLIFNLNQYSPLYVIRNIAAESPRPAHNRPADVKQRLDWYIGHRAKLCEMRSAIFREMLGM